MKVKSVETKMYRIPPTVPWEDSSHQYSGIEWIVTEITTDNGWKGTGWSYTVGWGGTAIKALVDDYLAPMVIGQDPLCVQGIWQQLRDESRGVGSGGITSLAITSIDVALWDIVAKHNGVPLYKILGGSRDRILAYGSGINLNLSLDDLLAQIEGYLAEGYQAVKIKVGKENPEEDVERVAAVRKLIGPNRMFLVDANQKWTAGEAVLRTTLLEPYRIDWMEEPIMSDDIAGHVHLRNSVKAPIAVGENLWNKFQFAEYIRQGACDIIQADVARVGGITEWMKIADLAQAANLPMAPHFVMEISLQVLCGVPNAMILENVSGGSLSEMGVLENPLKPIDGYMYPPEEPGHGVRFNKTELQKYEVTSETLKQLDLRVKKS
ncbi:mandelate racemase/muconate lactonizing enzyme family protein [bacterium LRH843]|nr:mandelate racemase/muconate lactonizing enzyme family protein [bacterium LRH843]